MPTEPTDDFLEVPIRITLSERDWEAFIAAIENPPPPNEKLLRLLRDYKPAE
jgi:uncharacterized protein (DUF1778 family)